MAYRLAMSIGTSRVNPLSAGAVTPTGAGACSMAYGPVANVCQSSVPVTNMVPITTITPIANTVMPQVSVGQPMGVSPLGAMNPWAKSMGTMNPWSKGQSLSPWSKTAPLGSAPGISTMGKSSGPWGVSAQATTGIAPGIYTTDVSMPMIW